MKRGLSDVVTILLLVLVAVAAIAIIWGFVNPTFTQASTVIRGGTFCLANHVEPVACSNIINAPSQTGNEEYFLVSVKRTTDDSLVKGISPLQFTVTYAHSKKESFIVPTSLINLSSTGATGSLPFTNFTKTILSIYVTTQFRTTESTYECESQLLSCDTKDVEILSTQIGSNSPGPRASDFNIDGQLSFDVSGSFGAGGGGYCSLKSLDQQGECEYTPSLTTSVSCQAMSGCSWNFESSACASKEVTDWRTLFDAPIANCAGKDETTCNQFSSMGCTWQQGTCEGITAPSCTSSIDRTCSSYDYDQETCQSLGCIFTASVVGTCTDDPGAISCDTWSPNNQNDETACINNACEPQYPFQSCTDDPGAISCDSFNDNEGACRQQSGCQADTSEISCNELDEEQCTSGSYPGCSAHYDQMNNCADLGAIDESSCRSDDHMGCSWDNDNGICSGEYGGAFNGCSGTSYTFDGCSGSPDSCDSFNDNRDACLNQEGCSPYEPFAECTGASSCGELSTDSCNAREGCTLGSTTIPSCQNGILGNPPLCSTWSILGENICNQQFGCSYTAGTACNPILGPEQCSDGCTFNYNSGSGTCLGGLPASCFNVTNNGLSCDSFSECQLQSIPAYCSGELQCGSYPSKTSCSKHSNACVWNDGTLAVV